tara:strand:+ start:527 stop:871 length:345 start_codon:yes stop_codon:yes gene_type:complete
MDKISREEILASSSGWVASLLNFLPGVGTGYLYQRRWVAYFLTTGTIILWFILGIIFQGNNGPSQNEQLIGVIGLFLISIITMVEAKLAFKKAVKITNIQQEPSKFLNKKVWFK